MIGTDYGTVAAVLSRQPLDYLVGSLAPFGIDDLHTGAMLMPFGRLALLPAIEYHGNRVVLFVPIGRKRL